MNLNSLFQSQFNARKKIAWVLLSLLLLFCYACEQKSPPAPPPPPKVTVSNPVRENVTDYLEFTGNTQAANSVQLRARVEGYLGSVFFRDGDLVKKDQLLFLIQQNTFLARLQQAEGNVQTQRALLDHAKIEFARFTRLYQQKAAAETDVENWRYQRDSAQAALLSAEAQRDLAKLDLGYTWVTAPFAGRIDRRLVDPGNLVGSGGSTVLAEMTQVDPLYVYFTGSETDIPPEITGAKQLSAVHPNRSKEKLTIHVGLAGEEGYPHEGFMDFASTTVSSTTGTLLLRGILPNPDGRILPGQFARIRLSAGDEKPALLVPQTAVGFDQLGSFVMVVNQDNKVERRNVKTGAQKQGFYVITQGLTGSESVIVKGLLRAVPGRQVTPEQAPEQQKAAAVSTENIKQKADK
ncbi:MAG: efflux RND transporter periplasmic adaptor subunit [Syntrophobacteraceae bacterium]